MFQNDGGVQIFISAASRIFEYDPSEVLGNSVTLLIDHDGETEQTGILASLRADHSRNIRCELKGLRKDGTNFVMKFPVSPMRHDGRQSYVGVCSDDTTRKQNEVKLLVARIKAERASEAKSSFLASMSHEIRTPMNGVLGMAGILLESDLTTEQRRQARIIKDAGEMLLSILNDFLDLSKIEAGQFDIEILDFNSRNMLDSTVAIWQPRSEEKGLHFSLDMPPDVPEFLRSDAGQIRQILFNLLNNAAKFTEQGSVSVSVSATPHPEDRLELSFEVADTGIGIPADVQTRLFNKFERADRSTTRKYGGTGLELAICREISQLLDGRIGVKSEPGRGSTFWFTIQCENGHAAANAGLVATGAANDKPVSASRSLRILEAEDNHINQMILCILIEYAGHRIDIVNDGIEAIAAVMRTPYDVILMDDHMPKMDGVMATRKFRNLPGDTGRIPIIAVTANAMKSDRKKILEIGMSDYVFKPIEHDSLFAAIGRCTGCDVPPVQNDGATQAAKVEPAKELTVDAASALENLLSRLDDLPATGT